MSNLVYFIGSGLVLCLGIEIIILKRIEDLQAAHDSVSRDVKDGAWTMWEPWNLCSATCGGGIRSRTRTCTNPSPSALGKFCDGDPTQYESCNQDCCQSSGGTGVAFTAYLSKSVTHLGHTHIIPFDNLLLNEGQGFNAVTHIFTCPVTGIYVFQTAVLSYAYGLVTPEIVKQGIRLVQAHAGAHHPGSQHIQGYNSVVTTCNRSEHVWVRTFGQYGHSVHSERYTTFSGFLLWESE